ncbi:MAG: DUF3108 domain-containing protein [Pseudolabrys sp.]|nr:DUF3108 domain-containing protein [Pseudolabrys sp.]
MQSLRQVLTSTLPLAAALAMAADSGSAWAQGRLDAQYEVTLAGIPIGKGSWAVDITDTRYSATVNGTTVGLMHTFAGGKGTSVARGTVQAGKPVLSVYESNIATRRKTDDIRLSIANGTVKEVKVEPPPDDGPGRVPVTDAHRRDVSDPLTGSLMRVGGTGDPLSAQACQNRLAIFDGRLRYDLHLAYKRMDTVRAERGYAGPVVVCSVIFAPVAGYNPSRYAIKYISGLRDMEVWLAPIAGTRVLVPFRAEGPSPVGRVVLEATQFVSNPLPSRASINGINAQ